MPGPSKFDTSSYTRGLALKRWNAFTAVLSGGVPALLLAYFLPHPSAIAVGFVLGLLWANFFEYAYHRWLLHRAGTESFRRHNEHHSSVGRANEPEHVPLGGSPKFVAFLFAIHGIPIILAEIWLRTGVASGMFAGFVVYILLSEDLHWRFHIGEWVPWFLEPARTRHLTHHDRPRGNYSIFFPLFDRLFGT